MTFASPPEPGRRRRRLTAITAAALVALGIAGTALAHPLGNFSVNHWSGIRVERGAIGVRYAIDLAEIPAFQEIQAHGITPEPAHPSLAPYLARRAETLAERLTLEVDGRRLTLEPRSREVTFPPGAAGLPTMRITIDYIAPIEESGRRLEYRDANFAGRAGWKEIVVTAGPGVAILESSAPETDRSRELSDYPTDLRDSFPLDLAARVVFAREGSPVAALSRPLPPSPTARDSSALALA
ncbi:MAG TPA: hypothetical protein VML54_02570, partial [Candidatus Limnocylindrales bacterium]|nr:hypothetical protein [Candidatus Limnocylindrales bacterium]